MDGTDGQTSWWPRADEEPDCYTALGFGAMTMGASWEWEQKESCPGTVHPHLNLPPSRGKRLCRGLSAPGMTVVWVRERWSGMLRRRFWLRARGVQPTPQHEGVAVRGLLTPRRRSDCFGHLALAMTKEGVGNEPCPGTFSSPHLNLPPSRGKRLCVCLRGKIGWGMTAFVGGGG